ncbi:MAG: helix-turn-helix domain-containing protein [Candidatus Omnitrophica bacterium]|nr:helix-turn-helix domain-containing protein [Candidatus Omnitrophota bacterium]
MPPELLTIDQVAEFLHLHVMTVYRLVKDGKLPGFKVGGRWRFHQEALDSWMADRAQAARLEAENKRLAKKAGNERV